MGTPAIDLATIAAGTGGFVIHGQDAGDRSGQSVASAGDVNGDGFGDLIIGVSYGDAAGNAKYDAGDSYVVFGRAAGWGTPIELATIAAGIGGFVIHGEQKSDWSGRSVASAGDVNGDGFDDLIIGAPGAGAAGNAKPGAGESYVVFGKAGGWGAAIDLATIAAGTGGFVIYGQDVNDFSGWSVASAGDVNGDGFADLIIGAWGGDAAGNAKNWAGDSYVVFGKAGGWGAAIDLATIAAGTGGFVIHGQDAEDRSGQSVASAGDLNGDGFDDLIIDAYLGDAAGNAKRYAGDSFVVFGKAAGWGAAIDLAAVAAGTGGFVIHGQDDGDVSGRSVASAGDVNGDGFADLIIGASSADAAGNAKDRAGDSYVVFGKAGGWGAAIDLATIAAGTGGFVIYGEDPADYSGRSVASAGDVNGDGFDDLIIGAPGGDAAGNAKYSAGDSYVVFGRAAGWGAPIDLATIAAGTGGFVIHGQDGTVGASGDHSGWSVASAGDVDGDGFDDLIIGAIEADAAGNEKNRAGDSYVIFGRDFTGSVTRAGTSAAETLAGTAGADIIVAGQGDDTILGLGGGDALQGGAGNDRIAVSDLGFLRVDGGSGTDTLALPGTGLTLNLASIANSRLQGIEAIDLGINALRVTALEVLNLSDSTNTLRVTGSAGYTLVFDDAGWVTGATAGGFTSFTKGQAIVLAQASMPAPTEGADTLTGTSSADTIDALGGNDLVGGLSGDDSLMGGAGADTLDGGAGSDTLRGGAGNDVYLMAVGDFPSDVIEEAAGGGTDRIDLTSNSTIYDLTANSLANIEMLRASGFNTLVMTAAQINALASIDGGFVFGKTGTLTLAAPGAIDLTGKAVNFTTFNGAAGDDTITGTAASETIAGQAGADSLLGGKGNDRLDGGAGTDALAGGEGNDTLFGGSEADTLTGGAGNDSLSGEADGDVLEGATGNDTLLGGLGADTLRGGADNDVYVFALADLPGDVIEEDVGGGIDRVDIGNNSVAIDLTALSLANIETMRTSGFNTLTLTVAQINALTLIDGGFIFGATSALTLGTAGAVDLSLGKAVNFTTFNGSSGDDTITATTANDTLNGQAGADSLRSGDGNDTLNGGTGNDTLAGGAGNDSLNGEADGDVLDGGGGNDTLLGGAGADTLRGGADNDVYLLPLSDLAGDVFVDLPGGGDDRIDLTSNSVTYDLTGLSFTGIEKLRAPGFNTLTLTAAQINALTLLDGGFVFGNTSTLTLGTAGAVDLSLGRAVNFTTFNGSSGGDTITATAANDTLNGQAGADSLRSGDGNDTLNGGTGNDTLAGGAGNDSLNGETDGDVLDGGGGNDTLDGGTGADRLLGGLGDDTFVVNEAGDAMVETRDGGLDTVLAGVSWTLVAHVENLTLLAAAAISGTGNNLANVITGNAGANILNGGGRADTLAGGGGNDTYLADATDVLVEQAGGGLDTVVLSASFTLPQHIEALRFEGSANARGDGNGSANFILGNVGNNRLLGYSGNDTLNGGAGNDTLSGGEGADSLVGGTGTDRLDGGNGNDVYVLGDLDMVIEAANAGIDTVLATISLTLMANVENLSLLDSANLTGMGNALANVILGNAGSNTLLGLGGADSLVGAGGNDTLVGGAEADTLSGGGGLDRFVYATALEGNDVITDYRVADDTLEVSALGFGGGLAIGMDVVAAGRYVANTSGLATSAAGVGQFVFESDARVLWWDADGTGGSDALRIATLTNVAGFVGTEIIVVA